MGLQLLLFDLVVFNLTQYHWLSPVLTLPCRSRFCKLDLTYADVESGHIVKLLPNVLFSSWLRIHFLVGWG